MVINKTVPLLTWTYVELAPRSKRLKYLLSFKPVKLLNKMVYFSEFKLLQKRKLSQLQICYLFSINQNIIWWKTILNFYKLQYQSFWYNLYTVLNRPPWNYKPVPALWLVTFLIYLYYINKRCIAYKSVWILGNILCIFQLQGSQVIIQHCVLHWQI